MAVLWGKHWARQEWMWEDSWMVQEQLEAALSNLEATSHVR